MRRSIVPQDGPQRVAPLGPAPVAAAGPVADAPVADAPAPDAPAADARLAEVLLTRGKGRTGPRLTFPEAAATAQVIRKSQAVNARPTIGPNRIPAW